MKSPHYYLLKDVLVVYVLEHCDEAGQLILHLVLCHSLCRLFQQIVTVFRQLDRHQGGEMTWSRQCFDTTCVSMCMFVCMRVLTSSGALQMDLGSLKFTTDVRA